MAEKTTSIRCVSCKITTAEYAQLKELAEQNNTTVSAAMALFMRYAFSVLGVESDETRALRTGRPSPLPQPQQTETETETETKTE